MFAAYLVKAVWSGWYFRSGWIPGGRLGLTLSPYQASLSASDSQISVTRQPPEGLGPPEWARKPLWARMVGMSWPIIPPYISSVRLGTSAIMRTAMARLLRLDATTGRYRSPGRCHAGEPHDRPP